MSYFKAEVKKYEKKYKKKSKTGNIREARTIQYSIPLTKDNPFKDEDFIYILTNDEFEHLDSVRMQYKKNKMQESSDVNNYKNKINALNEENQELKKELTDAKNKNADIQSKRDIIQKKLEHNKSQVQELTKDNQDLQATVARKQAKIDRLNEENKKALKDLNKEQNEAKDCREAKGQLKTLMKTFQSKGRFARWVAGLDDDIKILEGSIKMLSGQVQNVDAD